MRGLKNKVAVIAEPAPGDVGWSNCLKVGRSTCLVTTGSGGTNFT